MKAKGILAAVGLLVSYVLFGPASARADTTFDVAGHYASVPNRSTSPFTGTLTLNTATGNITAVNIMFPNMSAFHDAYESSPTGNNWQLTAFNPPGTEQLELTFSTSPTAGSLISFTDGTYRGRPSLRHFQRLSALHRFQWQHHSRTFCTYAECSARTVYTDAVRTEYSGFAAVRVCTKEGIETEAAALDLRKNRSQTGFAFPASS
jgi:hypothetical protein